MKKIIQTKNAPAAIGPYNQATIHNGIVYCSGQIPLDPDSMKVVGKTAAEQCEQVMQNMKEVLTAAESGFENVLKCTIFVRNMNDFESINDVYGSYFPENPPARATVEVSRLPKEVLVEIECIAHTSKTP